LKLDTYRFGLKADKNKTFYIKIFITEKDYVLCEVRNEDEETAELRK
jgi:hypothetical protein